MVADAAAAAFGRRPRLLAVELERPAPSDTEHILKSREMIKRN